MATIKHSNYFQSSNNLTEYYPLSLTEQLQTDQVQYTPSPLLSVGSIGNFHCFQKQSILAEMLAQHTTLVIVTHSAGGILKIGDKEQVLYNGQAFLFHPHKQTELNWKKAERVTGVWITLQLALSDSTANNRAMATSENIAKWLPMYGELQGVSPEQWLDLLVKLMRHREMVVLEPKLSDQQLSWLKEEELRVEILKLLLYSADNQQKIKGQRDYALQQTISYMEGYYVSDINRSELANIAQMSVWHFSEVFKQEYGISPMKFLQQLRLRRAKSELISSEEKVSVIAKRVGFKDEYYFSRLFKQTTGLSPTQYRKKKVNRIAAVTFPYTGHLLALGIAPYVGVVDPDRDQHRSHYFQHIPYQLGRSEQMPKEIYVANLSVLRKADPELIMCSEYEVDYYERSFKKQVPVAVIPWNALDWRQQLLRIAAIVGKQEEAKSWLSNYEQRAKLASQFIKNRIGNERVTLAHINEGSLYIYGRRNGGAVLYEDLGLTPAYEYETIHVSKYIEPEQLAQYVGEHLLIVINNDAASDQAWKIWSQSKAWLTLLPFQLKQVYRIEEMPWLDYSAHAHALIVEQAQLLFT